MTSIRASIGDVRYRRVDFGSRLAYEARKSLIENYKKGEATIDLASAALQIAAEDDALVSNSPVPFPVESYMNRMDRLSKTIGQQLKQNGVQDALKSCRFVEHMLFEKLGFKSTSFGRSNLAQRVVVDHPGVWEDQKFAYLNEVLISKIGIPAVLAILYQDVMKRLLSTGFIDFVVSIEHRDFNGLPKGLPIPGMTAASAIQSDGSVLNTCATDTLIEMLSYLKRAFWPFSWDANCLEYGGFKEGCRSLLQGEETAEHEAISRCAQHRLNRGIWTSTGGGDLTRAIAACERLVLLNADLQPFQRRDLALLYFCKGESSKARAEMDTFVKTPSFRSQSMEERQMTEILIQRLPHSITTKSHSQSPFFSNASSRSLQIDRFLSQNVPNIDFQTDLPLTW